MNPNILRSMWHSSLTFAILFLVAPWRMGLAQDSHAAQTAVRPQPPLAKIEPASIEMHGVRWTDPYAWMKDVPRNSPETIAYVEAENAYTDTVMRASAPLQERLFAEMLARVKETDLAAPVRIGDYFYYVRTEQGRNHPIHCRRKGSREAPEEIILDINELAKGHNFYKVANVARSPNHRLLAFAADTTGAEHYTIHFKDLKTGKLLSDRLTPVRSVTWANDNLTVFYVRPADPGKESVAQVFRHVLGKPQTDDALLFQEDDLAFGLYLARSRDQRRILLYSYDGVTSEARVLSADAPQGDFRLFAPRRKGVGYSLAHWQDRYFILTNADGATNGKVLWTLESQAEPERWREFIAHRDAVEITGFDEFREFAVVHERQDGLERIRILNMSGNESRYIDFPEPVYRFVAGENPDYNSHEYRITYESLVTPWSIYDCDLRTGTMKLIKRTEVLGGYDPANYISKRLYVMTCDGARVPISLVYRSDLFHQDGSNPLWLEAYGAYGAVTDADFTTTRLTLLDRGFVFAIAHVRGGGELGEAWHDQGKVLMKRNTFSDFIQCAEHLVKEQYTRADLLVARGGSAGGMLMGVAANWRPDLFRVVVAEVPAMDELHHMLDPALPGVTSHYQEWGDPRDPEQFEYFRSWDTYANIKAQDYPDMLVTAGLHDPRVPYWEPAKYVAKLRATKTDDHVLLLKTKMSGHSRAPGLHDFLRELAFKYAFVLERMGLGGTEPKDVQDLRHEE
jgi:oligopeptidase B